MDEKEQKIGRTATLLLSSSPEKQESALALPRSLLVGGGSSNSSITGSVTGSCSINERTEATAMSSTTGPPEVTSTVPKDDQLHLLSETIKKQKTKTAKLKDQLKQTKKELMMERDKRKRLNKLIAKLASELKDTKDQIQKFEWWRPIGPYQRKQPLSNEGKAELEALVVSSSLLDLLCDFVIVAVFVGVTIATENESPPHLIHYFHALWIIGGWNMLAPRLPLQVSSSPYSTATVAVLSTKIDTLLTASFVVLLFLCGSSGTSDKFELLDVNEYKFVVLMIVVILVASMQRFLPLRYVCPCNYSDSSNGFAKQKGKRVTGIHTTILSFQP